MAKWPDKWWDMPIAALDLETTGLSDETDQIVEVGIIWMRAGEVEKRYCKLVNPGCPIPEDSSKITGITDEDVKDAPSFAEIADEVAEHLQGRAILAYNLSFDKGFLERDLKLHGHEWPDSPSFDPLVLARGVFPGQRGYKLGLIAKRLEIPLEEAHRADHDAEAAARVMYAMGDHLPARLNELLELQSAWAIEQARSTAHWRRGPRQADASLVLGDSDAGDDDTFRLGPSYRYSRESDRDPLRFIYRRLPTSGGNRS